MSNRRPEYWRAASFATAIVVAIKLVLPIYYSTIPETPVGKGGRMMKVIPELPITIEIAVSGPWEFWEVQPTPVIQWVVPMIFWAAVAVGVEEMSFRFRQWMRLASSHSASLSA